LSGSAKIGAEGPLRREGAKTGKVRNNSDQASKKTKGGRGRKIIFRKTQAQGRKGSVVTPDELAKIIKKKQFGKRA